MKYKIETSANPRQMIIIIGFFVLIFISFGFVSNLNIPYSEYIPHAIILISIFVLSVIGILGRREIEVLNDCLVIYKKNETPQNIYKQTIKKIIIGKMISKKNRVSICFELADGQKIYYQIRKKDKEQFVNELKTNFSSACHIEEGWI